MNEIPLERLIACAAREVRMRRLIYPRWVEQRKMESAEAEYEIRCMEAIHARLLRLAGGGQRSLFDEQGPVASGQQSGQLF